MASASTPLRVPKEAPEDPLLVELRQEIIDAVEESDRDGWLTHEEVWRDVLGDDWNKELIDLGDAD